MMKALGEVQLSIYAAIGGYLAAFAST